MVPEELKALASRNIQDLARSGRLESPISAFGLLSLFVSLPSASRPGRSFRLTDLRKLENILEELAECWDAGTLVVSRDNEGLSIIQVCLDGTCQADGSRKRKRPVDEDADSAEEEAALASSATFKKSPSNSTLGSLSKESQEIYALLQKGTARHRLLTEQVNP